MSMSRNRYIPKIGENEYNVFNSARAVETSAIASLRAYGFNKELESKVIFDQNMSNHMASLDTTASNGFNL
jgi:hypothetical protein